MDDTPRTAVTFPTVEDAVLVVVGSGEADAKLPAIACIQSFLSSAPDVTPLTDRVLFALSLWTSEALRGPVLSSAARAALKAVATHNIKLVGAFLSSGRKTIEQELRSQQIAQSHHAPLKHDPILEIIEACSALLDAIPVDNPDRSECVEPIVSAIVSELGDHMREKAIEKLTNYNYPPALAIEIFEKVDRGSRVSEAAKLKVLGVLKRRAIGRSPGTGIDIEQGFLKMGSGRANSNELRRMLAEAIRDPLSYCEVKFRSGQMPLRSLVPFLRILKEDTSPEAARLLAQLVELHKNAIQAGSIIGYALVAVGAIIGVGLWRSERMDTISTVIAAAVPAVLIMVGLLFIVSGVRSAALLKDYHVRKKVRAANKPS